MVKKFHETHKFKELLKLISIKLQKQSLFNQNEKEEQK